MSDNLLPRNKVIHGDCITGMASLPSETVDLVLTDPPFAIDFKPSRGNYNRTDRRVLRGYSEVSVDDYRDFTYNWIGECARLLKQTGSMFIFSGWNNLRHILNAIDTAELVTVNHIIWKYQFGVVTKRKFVTSHYHCLYVCKDDKQRKFFPNSRFDSNARGPHGGSKRYQDMEDVWQIKREYWTGDQKTPTKLPREIIEKILAYTTLPGDLVFDPFMGSGQTAVVASLNGRDYLGFEIADEYHRFIEERLTTGKYRLRAEPDAEWAGEQSRLFGQE